MYRARRSRRRFHERSFPRKLFSRSFYWSIIYHIWKQFFLLSLSLSVSKHWITRPLALVLSCITWKSAFICHKCNFLWHQSPPLVGSGSCVIYEFILTSICCCFYPPKLSIHFTCNPLEMTFIRLVDTYVRVSVVPSCLPGDCFSGGVDPRRNETNQSPLFNFLKCISKRKRNVDDAPPSLF